MSPEYLQLMSLLYTAYTRGGQTAVLTQIKHSSVVFSKR